MTFTSLAKKQHFVSSAVVRTFLTSSCDFGAYANLFRLFLNSFIQRFDSENATVRFPGYPSVNGRYQDSIEGFTRFFPLISAWLSSGRQSVINLGGDLTVDLDDLVRRTLRNALDPKSRGYYGKISNHDNRVIAAALISLSLWQLKETVFENIGEREKQMISDWLNQVNTVEVADNNWHLFVVMVNAVLKRLGLPYSSTQYAKHYNRHKSFYLGNGWYSDGPEGIVDYYNAWEVHPFLAWIDQIDPELDRTFIRRTTKQFLESFIYFFSPAGFPIFGRSICYRLALPTAFILAEAFGWSSLKTGTARSALNAVWRHFLQRGAVRNGFITQGYYGESLDFLDNYSGPASCNWSLLSLAAALAHPSESEFWTIAPIPLPIEHQSYELSLPAAGMLVTGKSSTQRITVRLQINEAIVATSSNITISRFSLAQKVIVRFLSMLHLFDYIVSPTMPYQIRRLLTRPSNWEVKYKLSEYHSDKPYCID
ncbi:MAG: DUF2264 domain-containing protein [Proteobacteria bacterium]|nr:DUF2264 domain-containing protein [Pseudomonadota bacterium]